MDFEIFSFLDESATIRERLIYFKDADLIPPKLKELVVKESVARYVEAEGVIGGRKFSLKDQWVFLTAPIKNNNMEYFHTCVRNYDKNKVIRIPSNTTVLLTDSKWLEDKISEIELYLNLSRTLKFKDSEKEQIHKDKQILIAELDRILLDKKLSATKKCKLCPALLGIMNPYQYCNKCYEDKVSARYDSEYRPIY